MRNRLSFIHCADLHLDSPFKGLKEIPEDKLQEIRESTFKALEKLTEQAIQYEVDFVLMVGDIFDQEEQSLKAHMALKKAFEKLADYHIQVYVSFGNHDYVNSQSFPRNYPRNVHVFESEQVEGIGFWKEEKLQARIYGFSYENREVLTNKIKEYKKTTDSVYHIATLHGAYGQEKETGHATYAPFQLTELKSAGFDYWALGHIHKREILSEQPPIIYPGNIQGRSTKETGEKGCYLVTMEDDKHQIEFISLQHIRFEKIAIDASNWESIAHVSEQLATIIHPYRTENVFLQLLIQQVPESKMEWFTDGYIEEIIDYVNQHGEHSFIIDFKWKVERKRSEWQQGGRFLEELAEAFKETNATNVLQPLWKHAEGRKWLDELDHVEEKELLQEAEWLVEQLLHEKGV